MAPLTNTVITPGVHNYGTITIPAGVTVTTNGSGLLDLASDRQHHDRRNDRRVGRAGRRRRATDGPEAAEVRLALQHLTAATVGIPGGAGTGGVTPAGSPSNGCLVNGAGGANGGGSGSLGVSTVGGGGGGGPGGAVPWRFDRQRLQRRFEAEAARRPVRVDSRADRRTTARRGSRAWTPARASLPVAAVEASDLPPRRIWR